MEIRIKDRSRLCIEAKDRAVAAALEAIGQTVERHVKEKTPVDTGRLRNSITHATEEYSGQGFYKDDHNHWFSDGTARAVPEEGTVYIGTNVEYAKYVETGDSKHHPTGQAHFLRQAAANHGQEYKQILEKQLKQA